MHLTRETGYRLSLMYTCPRGGYYTGMCISIMSYYLSGLTDSDYIQQVINYKLTQACDMRDQLTAIPMIRYTVSQGAQCGMNLDRTVYNGHTEAVQILSEVSGGIDTGLVTIAVLHSNPDILRILIRAGAVINRDAVAASVTNGMWKIIIDTGVCNIDVYDGLLLWTAVTSAHVELVRQLLKHGADARVIPYDWNCQWQISRMLNDNRDRLNKLKPTCTIDTTKRIIAELKSTNY